MNVLSINFFPKDVLKWMKFNAKPRMALKLMQICKYFQHQKFPYFVVKNLHGDYHHGWQYWSLYGTEFQKTDIKSLPNNLWIIGDFNILSKNHQICELIPKIAVCDIRVLLFIDQNLTLEQFEILISGGNVELVSLNKTFINYENGEVVPLENIFDCLPNVESFAIFFNANSFVSYEKASEKHPPKLKSFRFCDIRSEFNVEECLKFVLNNQHIYFILELGYSRPVEQLQAFTDNLIQTWSLNFKPPFISFPGQTSESKRELGRKNQMFIVS